MAEYEEMQIFLREILMQIENDQNQLIHKLEDSHRQIESLNRDRLIVEEKLKDNISFFNPTCAKNREKLEEINQRILQEHNCMEQRKKQLSQINGKINTMGKIISFIAEHQPEQPDIPEEPKETFVASGISILEAQEMERQRIARDLHDSTVQSLTNIVHKTEFCSKMIDKDPTRVKMELSSMMEQIRTSIDDMRQIIYNLRPMSIDDLGLVPTLQRFIQQHKEEHKDMEFQVLVKSSSDEIDLPPVVTVTIYRIIQEACNNIFKYANAKKVLLSITYGEEEMEVEVRDDGIGFDKAEIGTGDKKSSGFGLSIMQERAQLLSGTFSIESVKGEGTSVKVAIPYDVIKEIPNQKKE